MSGPLFVCKQFFYPVPGREEAIWANIAEILGSMETGTVEILTKSFLVYAKLQARNTYLVRMVDWSVFIKI